MLTITIKSEFYTLLHILIKLWQKKQPFLFSWIHYPSVPRSMVDHWFIQGIVVQENAKEILKLQNATG